MANSCRRQVRQSSARETDAVGILWPLAAYRGAAGTAGVIKADDQIAAGSRSDELETEGDQDGAAIWRRVTVAIEQLTDRTGTLH